MGAADASRVTMNSIETPKFLEERTGRDMRRAMAPVPASTLASCDNEAARARAAVAKLSALERRLRKGEVVGGGGDSSRDGDTPSVLALGLGGEEASPSTLEKAARILTNMYCEIKMMWIMA